MILAFTNRAYKSIDPVGLLIPQIPIPGKQGWHSGRTTFNLSLPLRVHLDAHVFTMDMMG